MFAKEPLSTIHYLPSTSPFLQAALPGLTFALEKDRIRGALLGTAVGDALGMPVEGLSHQNIRTYYKGIKEYRADEERGDLEAGQWTDDTQLTFAVARALASTDKAEDISDVPERVAEAYVQLLPEARRWGPTTTAAVERLRDGATWQDAGDAEHPTDGAATRAAPLGLWWAATDAGPEQALEALRPVLAVTHAHPAALTAGLGQAFAVRYAARTTIDAFEAAAFWEELVRFTAWVEDRLAEENASPDPRTPRALPRSASGRCSRRLRALDGALHQGTMPLDLRDLCDGAGYLADEAWPLAVGMFARTPHLVEAALLSTVNVGGDADTTGALCGALLGALHGWSAFPEAWREGLEAAARLTEEADALAERLSASGSLAASGPNSSGEA